MIKRILRLIPARIRALIRSRLRDMGWVVIRIPIESEFEVEAPARLRGVESAETDPTTRGVAGKDPALRPYRLNMHHVGGRGGGFPFPVGRTFFPDVEMYIYDADPACRAQMEASSPYVDHVIVAAVAGSDGKGVFHVNYDPFTSSLLPANGARPEFFYQDEECDYIFEDVLQPIREIPVVGESLDTLAKKHGFQIDYLSLDVQGSEHEVLAGMSDATLANTVAVMCEVSFLQLYANQRLFDEVIGLLRARGFFMAHLYPLGYAWAECRTGIGWRSQGYTGVGDALFFREVTSIAERAHEPFAALLKAAFIAMCVGNIFHAVQCLTKAYKSPAPDVLAQAGRVGYIRFLDDMYRLYRMEEHIYPPRFRHVYSAEESLARFEVGADVVPDKARARTTYFAETDEAAFRRTAAKLLSSSPTAFERLLRENGFAVLADDVAKKRVTGIRQVLEALDLNLRPGR